MGNSFERLSDNVEYSQLVTFCTNSKNATISIKIKLQNYGKIKQQINKNTPTNVPQAIYPKPTDRP